MRDDLIGYLFGALDDADMRRVEAALSAPDEGPPLRRELETLRLAMRPLGRDRESFAAPTGLAGRTMQFISRQSPAATAAPPRADAGPLPTPRPVEFSTGDDDGPIRPPRAWIDRAIMAASALAACVLVAPLLLDTIAESRERRAERNLQRLSGALHGHAESHRIYPTPPAAGPLSRAGLYAPTLVSEERLVADDGTVLCPGSPLSQSGRFRVPTLEELRAAVGTPRFDELVRGMGGDYGYTLGHRDAAGILQPNRAHFRGHHPLVADAPDHSDERSDNHPQGIHHVLYEDGQIKTLRPDALHLEDDHLYRNHDGHVAAGTDPEDAVIGDSHDRP
jgi:hypothetical protein